MVIQRSGPNGSSSGASQVTRWTEASWPSHRILCPRIEESRRSTSQVCSRRSGCGALSKSICFWHLEATLVLGKTGGQSACPLRNPWCSLKVKNWGLVRLLGSGLSRASESYLGSRLASQKSEEACKDSWKLASPKFNNFQLALKW